MASSIRQKRLLDAYRFPGFHPLPEVVGVLGDPHAQVVRLVRRSKKRLAAAVESTWVGTIMGVSGGQIDCTMQCFELTSDIFPLNPDPKTLKRRS
jgi:hypothetical protein